MLSVQTAEYNILFTIGAIEAIQETNEVIRATTMPAIARVADFKTDSEDVKTFYNVIAVLLTVDTGRSKTQRILTGL
ncbi:MAG: hypothetical protein ACLU6Y_01480 [Ruminococcus sp.]